MHIRNKPHFIEMAKMYFKSSVFSFLGALIYFGSVNTLIIILKDFKEFSTFSKFRKFLSDDYLWWITALGCFILKKCAMHYFPFVFLYFVLRRELGITDTDEASNIFPESQKSERNLRRNLTNR